MTSPIRVEIDGRAATADRLQYPALVNYGHFTVMQVRGGRTRGLDLHLDRLEESSRELFDVGVDAERIRDHVRHALDGIPDATVRVSVFRPDDDGPVSALVTVRPPAEAPDRPQALMSVVYQRPVPHIKHAGTFGQIYHGLAAERRGFHDALLTAPDGTVSETGMSNLAVHDGQGLVWPDAPCLAGITMRLLLPRLDDAGIATRRGPVRLADLPSAAAALLSNSSGVASVGRVDDLAIPVDPKLLARVAAVYDSVPWDPI